MGPCERHPFRLFTFTLPSRGPFTKSVQTDMTLGKTIEKVFQMENETWKRHANPWSGWTRVPILPLLVLAIWSRVWIGWGALLPIIGLLLWTWVNPHLFPPPASTENWMSKGVLGERVWMNRDQVPIPDRHRGIPMLLALLSVSGLIPVGWGLYRLWMWPTLLGTVLTVAGKMWFLDRMVWLYEDVKADPAYDRWMSL